MAVPHLGGYGGTCVNDTDVTEVRGIFASTILHRIATARSKEHQEEGIQTALELDSHADSPVVGRGVTIIERTNKKVSVSGFSDRLGKPIKVEVVNACLAYDDDRDGKTYLIVIRNALHIPDMDASLISPIMMRLAGVDVDECPKFLSRKPSIENHSIFFRDLNLRIPMKLDGVISYIPCRSLQVNELHDNDGMLEVTPNVETWNPKDDDFGIQEELMVDFSGNVKEFKPRNFIVSSLTDERSYDPELFCNDVVNMVVSVVRSRDGGTKVKPEDLSQLWNISNKMARKTIQATTVLCPRNADDITLNRRYGMNDRMIRYRHLPVVMFSDTKFASKRAGKSIRNFTAAQVFVTDFDWCALYLLEFERDAPRAFKMLFKDVGVPEKMVMDGARVQVKGDVEKMCNDAGCKIMELEKDSPASNRAERTINELKTSTKYDMKVSKSPLVLWCFCLKRRSLIHVACARNNYRLAGATPHSYLTGDVTDISNIASFKWYEWVKYRKEGAKTAYPFPSEHLGKCLGPAENKGNAMSQFVLTMDGAVLPIQTLRKLTESEMESEKTAMNAFDEKIKKRYGDHLSPPSNWRARRVQFSDEGQHDDLLWENEDEPEPERAFPYEDEGGKEHQMPEIDEVPDLDRLIGAEVVLPKDGTAMKAGKVIGRALDKRGYPLGVYNEDPMLDSRIYEVMFPDGTINQYSSNLIAESIWSEVDADGRRQQLMEEIVGFEKGPEALSKEEGYITSGNGQKKKIKTTKGFNLLFRWTDGQQSWVALKDAKESYPVEVAEFAVDRKIDKEPAFSWWVPSVLKKREQIISAVKARVKKRTHKFGIEVPRTVEDAYRLDKENGNSYWRDAIQKEMKNVMPAFQVLENDENIPVGYSNLTVHMIFDVKLDLTRKARLVADGHKTADPLESTYAGVVSRESVRIALTYATLMGLKVWGADIQNAYISAPTSKKFWITCGPEFGSEIRGKKALVRRALYGTKSASRDFRNHLRDCMEHLGYVPCRADSDMWMCLSRRSTGEEYYEYALLYVDDCLMVSENPKESLDRLGKYFTLKDGSVGEPQLYLGAKISKVMLPNGVEAYAWSPSKYVNEAIKNLEKQLDLIGLKLKRGVNAPLDNDYRPECDLTPECSDEKANLYMSLIGVLRWMVEIGRIDLTCEVSMMSSYSAAPREGHFAQLLRIFSYLKQHHHSRIVFDPSYPIIDTEKFPKRDWNQYYGERVEEFPSDCPRPLGKELVVRAFVDADFAGDRVTRRSRTGFIVLLNSAPIFWYSKKQSSCETSTFGSEFIAMKTCCEYIKGLRIKLKQMGLPIENPAFVFGDNQSVLWNTSLPDSVLKKKTSSVAFNFVREGVSRDQWRTSYIKSNENPADILTKSLPAGLNRKRKIRGILYDIYPELEDNDVRSNE